MPRARGADPRHGRVRRDPGLVGPRRPRARQALHRRRRRQCQPDARARGRRVRRLRADDLRAAGLDTPAARSTSWTPSPATSRSPTSRCSARSSRRWAAPSSARPQTSRPPTSASTPFATSRRRWNRSRSSPRRSCRRSSRPASKGWSWTSRPAPARSWHSFDGSAELGREPRHRRDRRRAADRRRSSPT